MYQNSLAPIGPRYSRRTIRNRKLISVITLAAIMAAIIIITIPTAPVMAKSEPANAAAKIGDINVNDGFAELVKAVKPAVVNISVIGHTKAGTQGLPFNFEGQSPQLEEFFKRFFGEQPNLPGRNQQNQGEQPAERKTRAVGSGFIVDPEGLVVTNFHVIEGADEIEVVFDDGTRVPASLKGADEKTDLALLEINTDRILPYVEFGESDDAEVGDWVIAIGNPFGLGGTTTSGIISARGRDIRSGPLDDFIQIDASINRGNSGGPLFNTKGQVIGVNSAIFSPNGGSVGIGFAIPSSMADNVITQLQENGTVQRGYLGVHIQSITEEIADSLGLDNTAGALVSQVMEDSPAEKAGIESGDVILSYGGKKLSKMRDLPKLVALTAKDTEVEIEIWRDDQNKTLHADIGSNDEPQLASALINDDMSPSLGLSLASLDSKKIEKYGLDENAVGVVIVDVAPNSSAAERGLREGDLITRVDKTEVTSPDDVVNAIASSRESKKDSVLLLVERDSQARFIVVPMEA
jgi:serine protease Do